MAGNIALTNSGSGGTTRPLMPTRPAQPILITALSRGTETSDAAYDKRHDRNYDLQLHEHLYRRHGHWWRDIVSEWQDRRCFRSHG